MEMLLILTYGAICLFIFKVFRVPVNKWTVPSAVLGGVVIIGTLVTAMNYNHPYSERVRKYVATTPIVPTTAHYACGGRPEEFQHPRAARHRLPHVADGRA